MAKSRDKRGREDKKKKKPKASKLAALASVDFRHHSVTPAAPPVPTRPDE